VRQGPEPLDLFAPHGRILPEPLALRLPPGFDDGPAHRANAVPEPATLGLVAAGVAGLALHAPTRRRRR
jgi:hypothetical protein